MDYKEIIPIRALRQFDAMCLHKQLCARPSTYIRTTYTTLSNDSF